MAGKSSGRAYRSAPRVAGSVTPLVGRGAELADLNALLDSGRDRPRRRRLVLIVGEPGIGKTRLVQELFAEVDARPEMITWRQGRCPSFGESISVLGARR